MGRGIAEWPANDVLQRKYSESWVIFDDGALFQAWCDTCEFGPTGYRFICRHQLVVGPLPVYYPFKSGYYVSSKGDNLFLERKFTHHKNFKIGLDSAGWACFKINPITGEERVHPIGADVPIDLLHPPETTKFMKLGVGVCSRKYFLSESGVFFKGNLIGSRENNIILLDNSFFTEDLQRVLGPLWQVR